MTRQCLRQLLILIVAIIGLTAVLGRTITGAPVVSDAVENLRMGVNLAHHGVISGDTIEPVEPTMYREPLPAVANAIGVRIVDAVMGRAEMDDYFSGPRAKYIKYQNLFWTVTMTLAILGLLVVLTKSFYLSLAGALIVNFYFPLLNQHELDTLFTEPVSKALFATSIFFLAWWAHRESRVLLFFAGLAFGFLTLTKAVFLYVFIGLVIVLPLVQVLFRPPAANPLSRERSGKVAADLAVLSVAFLVITLPWMWRNYVLLGDFAMSERSGMVLMTRAIQNQMTADEYAGSFYLYAPNKPVKFIVSLVTDFGPHDLQRGGRLQRLNISETADFFEEDFSAEQAGRPEDAITYYRQLRALRVKLTNEYEVAGHSRPMAMADKDLKKLAIDLIREHPRQHLAQSVAQLWRGGFDAFVVLLVALAYAAWTRRKDIALTVLPPLGMIVLYALATSFSPRFGRTAMPLVVAVVLVVLFAAWNQLRDKVRLNQRTAVPEPGE